MNVTVLDRKPDPSTQLDRSAASHLGFIDCDVHPTVPGMQALLPSKRMLRLGAQRWRPTDGVSTTAYSNTMPLGKSTKQRLRPR